MNASFFDSLTAPDLAITQDLQEILHKVVAANKFPALRQAASDLQATVHRLVEHAPEAETLTRTISTLNDALTWRVIELSRAGTPIEKGQWCWISLGSEGRQEQTLSSDQDNGIIFTVDGPPDSMREELLPLAKRINDELDTCGFPLCRGQIMASNPQWCLSLDEWRERFSEWIVEGDPQALLNASIFFDLRPLYGAKSLAGELTDWLAVEAAGNSRFLFQMTANALRRETPLGLMHKFAVEKSGPFAGTIDLKLNAATLFVDAARIYALACGSRARNTADRLRLTAESHRLHPGDVDKWIKAFYVIQKLRLRIQHRNYATDTAMNNRVDPSQLDAADRRALFDALLEGRRLQTRLALDYPGSS